MQNNVHVSDVRVQCAGIFLLFSLKDKTRAVRLWQCGTVCVRGPREEDDESSDVKTSDVGGFRPRVRIKEVRQFISRVW